MAILAAAYFLIVRPVLDTTNDAIEKGSELSENAIRQGERAIHESNLSSAQSQLRSYEQSLQSSWPAAARAVRACGQKAGDDLGGLNQCVNFAQRVAHTVQSDRSFALAYADSLAAQGDAAAADGVRKCVKKAGFETAAMQRCRNLADHLLFG